MTTTPATTAEQIRWLAARTKHCPNPARHAMETRYECECNGTGRVALLPAFRRECLDLRHIVAPVVPVWPPDDFVEVMSETTFAARNDRIREAWTQPCPYCHGARWLPNENVTLEQMMEAVYHIGSYAELSVSFARTPVGGAWRAAVDADTRVSSDFADARTAMLAALVLKVMKMPEGKP